jgi:hypothetical protein
LVKDREREGASWGIDAGYGAALLATLYGVIHGLVKMDWGDVVVIPPYSHAMLPAIVGGGLAALIALARLVVVSRSFESLTLFWVGLVAAASPFITVFLLGLAVTVALLWLFTKMN